MNITVDTKVKHEAGQVYKYGLGRYLVVKDKNSGFALVNVNTGEMSTKWYDSLTELDEANSMDQLIEDVDRGPLEYKVGSVYKLFKSYFLVVRIGEQYALVSLNDGYQATKLHDSLESLAQENPEGVLVNDELIVSK